MSLLLFLLSLILPGLVLGDITGTVTVVGGPTTIQQAGSTYKFQIQGSNPFQPQGKVLIVFPSTDFQFAAGTILTCSNLDDLGKALDC